MKKSVEGEVGAFAEGEKLTEVSKHFNKLLKRGNITLPNAIQVTINIRLVATSKGREVRLQIFLTNNYFSGVIFGTERFLINTQLNAFNPI